MLQTPYKLIAYMYAYIIHAVLQTELTVGSSAGVQHTACAQVLVMGHVPSCPSTGCGPYERIQCSVCSLVLCCLADSAPHWVRAYCRPTPVYFLPGHPFNRSPA